MSKKLMSSETIKKGIETAKSAHAGKKLAKEMTPALSDTIKKMSDDESTTMSFDDLLSWHDEQTNK